MNKEWGRIQRNWLNIKPKEKILNTKDLPHLVSMETDSSQYKLGNSLNFLVE